MQIPKLAYELNRAAAEFEIGCLQEERKRRLSLKKLPYRGIFNEKSVHEDYAFHVGGRRELQFNIGKDYGDIRHGVAFSLQPSKALPSIEPLLPKIKGFNDYVQSHAEDLADFRMWHWCPPEQNKPEQERSNDRPVAPISDDLVQPGYFIMLGRKVPLADVNAQHVKKILADFDRLLPSYVYVEESDGYFLPNRMRIDFKPGCTNFIDSTTSTFPEGRVDVALRHQKFQKDLYKHLCREAGPENVGLEQRLAFGVRIDAVVRQGRTYTFYELKIAPTVKACVRAALGQLLEYAYWPSAERASELVVVGEAKLRPEDREYLRLLRCRFELPLWYRRLSHDALEERS